MRDQEGRDSTGYMGTREGEGELPLLAHVRAISASSREGSTATPTTTVGVVKPPPKRPPTRPLEPKGI